jgi:hypothetical protein
MFILPKMLVPILLCEFCTNAIGKWNILSQIICFWGKTLLNLGKKTFSPHFPFAFALVAVFVCSLKMLR